MSVGQQLAEARSERGISVEAVSAATRIRAGLIREIEADDYHGCGGDVYARGHIRSMARFIGIDSDPLIAEYDEGHHVEPSVVPTPQPEVEQDALAHTERRRPNWTFAMVAALLVVIAAAAYGLVQSNHNSTGPKTVAQGGPSSTPTTSPATPPTTSTPKVPKSAESAINPNRAVMQVRVLNSPTWLQVTNATGSVLFESTLQPGQQKRFSSTSALAFVIGNAPAVDLTINGRDIGSPHSSTVVARGIVEPGSQQIQQA